MKRTELTAHLVNNMCLGASKYQAKAFKDASSGIIEEGFTNDKIRRLVNGGDKFHPYL